MCTSELPSVQVNCRVYKRIAECTSVLPSVQAHCRVYKQIEVNSNSRLWTTTEVKTLWSKFLIRFPRDMSSEQRQDRIYRRLRINRDLIGRCMTTTIATTGSRDFLDHKQGNLFIRFSDSFGDQPSSYNQCVFLTDAKTVMHSFIEDS